MTRSEPSKHAASRFIAAHQASQLRRKSVLVGVIEPGHLPWMVSAISPFRTILQATHKDLTPALSADWAGHDIDRTRIKRPILQQLHERASTAVDTAVTTPPTLTACLAVECCDVGVRSTQEARLKALHWLISDQEI